MKEVRYTISEMAKLTQTEPHVLRYWEEELNLPIARNEMGHRYYTEKDLQVLQRIKELKKNGLQLRAIREKIHREIDQKSEDDQKSEEPAVEKTREQQFDEIMERLIREIRLGERKEGRYRRLDEAIRRHQQSRKMAAVTEETKKKHRRNTEG